jgi:hypothetical protein
MEGVAKGLTALHLFRLESVVFFSSLIAYWLWVRQKSQHLLRRPFVEHLP